MKMMVLSAIAALLSGCATMSDVAQTGKDTYTVSNQQRGGLTSWGEIKQAALKRANEFCAAKGLHMVSVDMQTHGVRSLTPQEAELTFRCVSDTDPAWQGGQP